VKWGPGGSRRRVVSTWNAPIKWHRQVLETGTKARVFCSSLSDIFDDHPSILPEWRKHLWQTVRNTPMLDWLLLTKRPENFESFLPADWGEGYPNVCLMVTVENQEFADKRIPVLTATPSRWRGLSVEPILDRVDLSPWIKDLDWVIVGGETLTGARPMNPNWVREIRDLCRDHRTPLFLKQWGWWTPEVVPNAKDVHVFPDGETVYYRGNKKLNGNMLDGRKHLEHPFREHLTLSEQRLARNLHPDEITSFLLG